ncbi:LOW QUALITY PROTEIN: ULK/ULK protein kinase, partial [Phytophthora palmivora]
MMMNKIFLDDGECLLHKSGTGSGDHDAEASLTSRRGTGDRRSRAFSVSHEVSSSSRFSNTAPSSLMHQSRSGNLEVMETAFASAGSGFGALRRSSSSRLARSRRSSSSSSGPPVAVASGTSPKLSPQMSPHILPSPSPRINPFKQLSESPPGVAALQQQQHSSLPSSSRIQTHITTQPNNRDIIVPTRQKNAGGGGPALDSSGEYVLVDGLSERPGSGGAAPRSDVQRACTGEVLSRVKPEGDMTAKALTSTGSSNSPTEAYSRDYGQQLVDIVVLRTQAIAPIADQLWMLSAAGDAEAGIETGEPIREDWPPQQTAVGNSSLSTSGGKRASGVNFSTVFSMSSSLASSVGASNTLGDDEDCDDDDDEDEKHDAERQYVCAAEALALYIKCLRLVQHVVLYLRQDPVFAPSRCSLGSTGTSVASPGWHETSWKVSMTFLTDQLTRFLNGAEQCKARITRAARLRTSSLAISSQEE